MKSSIIAASFLTSLALATPLNEQKRDYYTSWDVETATVTVTAGQWGNWGQQAAATTTAAPAPWTPATSVVPTQAAAQSTWTDWSSSAAAAAPSAAPSAVNTAGLSDYAAPIVLQHNLHRANHSAPALEWDEGLASIAATIAASCVYAHDTSTGGGGYGQNIGAGAPGDQVNAMITNEMYNDEIGWYPGYGSNPNMGNFEHWGHFSQIVWKDTTKIGCATQYCSGGLANTGGDISPYFTVCNYEPAGNFGGQYADNVLAPLGQPVIIIPSGQ